MHHLGHAHYYSGEWQVAVPILERCVDLLRDIAAKERWGRATLIRLFALIAESHGLSELGDMPRAVEVGIEGVNWAESTGYAFAIERACGCLGHVHLQRGDAGRAIPLLERARALCEEHGHVVSLPWILSELSFAYAVSGAPDRARIVAREAMSVNMPTAIKSGHSGILIRLAEVHHRASSPEEAERLARLAAAQASEFGERGYLAHAQRLLADILAPGQAGDREASLELYRGAIALSEELGLRPLLAHGHLGLGKLYRRMGRVDDARTSLGKAVEMLSDMGMAFWLPEAEQELAQVRREA